MSVVPIWESSALVQRYAPEPGSATVNVLFSRFQGQTIALAVTAYSETFAALVRKRNAGILNPASFSQAVAGLENETLYNPSANVLDVDFHTVLSSVSLIERHNLNSSDASALVAILAFADSARAAGETPLLIATDRRFIRAAQAEGLQILDPEQVPPADIVSVLQSL